MIEIEAGIHAAATVLPIAVITYIGYKVLVALATKLFSTPKQKRKLTKDLWSNKNGVKMKSKTSDMSQDDIDWLEENMK